MTAVPGYWPLPAQKAWCLPWTALKSSDRRFFVHTVHSQQRRHGKLPSDREQRERLERLQQKHLPGESNQPVGPGGEADGMRHATWM
mmetsp:Transcript_15249/g.32914  ORF Transcript_15249/g.32914 Transcript_15249/m.32914 type:complete len:87 (-) Transcript_15249:87-347(-)